MKKRLIVVGFSLLMLLGVNSYAGELKISPSVISAGKITLISYTVDKASSVTVSIYTEKGVYVRTLFCGLQEAGSQQVIWDGKDDEGIEVPAGKYLVKVESDLKADLDKSFGEEGVIKGFKNPIKIKVDTKGDIYLLDPGKAKVYKYHQDGSLAKDFKDNNYFSVGSPIDMDIDSLGNIYIVYGDSVNKHDSQGNFQHSIGGYISGETDDREASDIQAISTGPGDRLYIFCWHNACKISVYDTTKPGFEGYLYEGQNQLISGVIPRMTSDASGNIWLMHYAGLRKLTDTGKTVRLEDYSLGFESKTKRDWEKGDYPVSPYYAGRKTLWIVDRNTHQIMKLFDSGSSLNVVWRFGDENVFKTPRAIAVKGDSLYVADDGEGTLSKYKLSYSSTSLANVIVE